MYFGFSRHKCHSICGDFSYMAASEGSPGVSVYIDWLCCVFFIVGRAEYRKLKQDIRDINEIISE